MRRSFDLRKPKSPPAEEPKVEQRGNVLPLQQGKIVYTTQETEDLQELEFNSDMVLPDELPGRIAAAKKAQLAEMRAAMLEQAKTGEPLKMPKTVAVKDLSPERKSELKQVLSQAQVQHAKLQKLKEQRAAIGQINPGVQAAAAAAYDETELFDSGEDEDPEALTTSPPYLPGGKAKPKVETAPAADEDEQPPVSELGLAGTCCNCGWDLAKTSAPEAAYTDKFNFVSAVTGGEFAKEYSLFGGKLKAVFRMPSVRMIDLVSLQLSIDQQHGRIVDFENIWRRREAYMTLVSLKHISVRGSGEWAVAEELDGAASDEHAETLLPHCLEQMTKEPPFNAEAFWQAIVEAGKKFDALWRHLKDRAGDESFYAAIAG